MKEFWKSIIFGEVVSKNVVSFFYRTQCTYAVLTANCHMNLSGLAGCSLSSICSRFVHPVETEINIV